MKQQTYNKLSPHSEERLVKTTMVCLRSEAKRSELFEAAFF